jgi:hypothetical protein
MPYARSAHAHSVVAEQHGMLPNLVGFQLPAEQQRGRRPLQTELAGLSLWSRLERKNADARKRSGQPLHVARIAGCDDCGVEMQRRRYYKRIDRVRGRQLQALEQMSCLPSEGAGQVEHLHAGIVEQKIDGCILLGTATDLSQYWRRNPDEGPVVMGKAENGRSSPGQDCALGRVGERSDTL